MRHRIKCRLFMMGMAMMAGAYGSAYAKGGKLGEHDYSSGWSVDTHSTLPFDQRDESVVASAGMLSRIKSMLGEMDLTLEGGLNAARRHGWRLQLVRPAAVETSDDPRLSGKPVGVALHLSF